MPLKVKRNYDESNICAVSQFLSKQTFEAIKRLGRNPLKYNGHEMVTIR